MYTLKNHDLYYRQIPLEDSKFTPRYDQAVKFKTKAEAQFVLREHKILYPKSNLRVAEIPCDS